MNPPKFKLGDLVRKTKGSRWSGVVVGTYSAEKGSVQIYPAAALEMQSAQKPSNMNLNDLSALVHAANINWWKDIHTGLPIQRNKGELLALIHSEISEALEGERKNLMDDKLPHRKMAEVELVDAIIRILDYAGGFGYDLQGAFDEKMAYNAKRKDHQVEARKQAGGKAW